MTDPDVRTRRTSLVITYVATFIAGHSFGTGHPIIGIFHLLVVAFYMWIVVTH